MDKLPNLIQLPGDFVLYCFQCLVFELFPDPDETMESACRRWIRRHGGTIVLSPTDLQNLADVADELLATPWPQRSRIVCEELAALYRWQIYSALLQVPSRIDTKKDYEVAVDLGETLATAFAGIEPDLLGTSCEAAFAFASLLQSHRSPGGRSEWGAMGGSIDLSRWTLGWMIDSQMPNSDA
jgi:hypothetical protein